MAAEDNYVRRGLALFAGQGEAEAIVHGDRRITYAELRAGVFRVAGALLRHGVRPGAAIAVLAGNRPEAVYAQLALHLLGCRSVWVAPNAPPALCAEYLALAEVDGFVYDPSTHAAPGLALARHLPHLPVWCLGADGDGPDLTAPDGAWPLPETETSAGTEAEPQSLFQTGGTTGRPKLVHHRHDFFRNVLDAAIRQRDAGGPRLRQLAVAGFWHSSQQASGLITLFSGGLLVQHDAFDAGRFLQTVQRERITVATLPPPMLYQVLDHPDLPGTDTSSLAMLSCAGSAVAPSRLAEAMDRFGPVLLVAYGMSEATLIAAYPAASHDPAHPERLASCGQPVGTSRVEIRDDVGTPLPPGEVGEVWASARLMTSGYWGQPELTASTLVDGWLRTGDLGYLDDGGYLYLVDRAKDMIVTGLTSSNVYSRTVEDVLAAHPAVREAAVIGVPDERLGEAVHAVVRLRPGARAEADELRQWCTERLNDLWAPLSVEFVSRLPLTGLGKVDKKALRAVHAAGRGSARDRGAV
ncbi:AMP-binding protein [Catellatospora bangladeshensis]|uniref:Acyl-CoA synthetase n=1 Tax=Catellatospora bangladeshensis TaxID=310355 RepID=A0A8J3JAS4_9ACTN|nr:AMP-binding protein [Catellatospora bangladeshensis]GIF80781.1 acyl-CoA synthetase [Catellatospora bangladeshensis]